MAARSSLSRCPICRAVACRAGVGLRSGRVCPTNVAARWRNITDGLVSSTGGFLPGLPPSASTRAIAGDADTLRDGGNRPCRPERPQDGHAFRTTATAVVSLAREGCRQCRLFNGLASAKPPRSGGRSPHSRMQRYPTAGGGRTAKSRQPPANHAALPVIPLTIFFAKLGRSASGNLAKATDTLTFIAYPLLSVRNLVLSAVL